MSDWHDLQMRVPGGANQPNLVYLPGMHGDSTLVSSFRAALGGRVHLIELTYPRTVTWSIEEHAVGILKKLRAHNIQDAWLLAESFGSVIGWELIDKAAQHGFTANGIILSGGFVRYPWMITVRLVGAINRAVPLSLIKLLCWGYGRYAVLRHRRAPETLASVSE